MARDASHVVRAVQSGGLTAVCAAIVLGSAAAYGAVPGPRPDRPVTVTTGRAPLLIPCGPTGTSVSAAWFFPSVRRPSGLVWLQHGFFRTDRNLQTLARDIAARARAVVVTPTLSSNPFVTDGCWINGPAMSRGVAALFTGGTAALHQSAEAARGRRVTLPKAFVLAGHSAGGNLATAAAGDTTLPGGAIRDLRGVVLFDGVDYGGAMPAALAHLTGASARPVLQIASPPSLCNAFGSGTKALLAARPHRFVGVELLGGTHIDAEGPDTDPLAKLACGVPHLANVRALRSIAADWVRNMLTGSALGITGGRPGERIRVGGATAVVLPAPSPTAPDGASEPTAGTRA